MNVFKLQDLQMLHLLWALPLLLGLYMMAARMRRRALHTFVDSGLLGRIRLTVSPARRRWKAGLVLLATLSIVAGLTRPSWNPRTQTVHRRGRDVVFVLDVSRSMLAEDLRPNRLERAKLAIRDCLEALRGDRVALVAFAGTAAVKCPLTRDYGFFRMMLEDASPESIARGGTMIGDAVRKTLDEVFDDRLTQFKDIILITDGEDHDSFPVEAAAQAGERGIRILAVGLGDETEGARIPAVDGQGRPGFLTHDGREVRSRLDADTLRRMAAATPGGKYLHVATGAIDLGQVYRDLSAGAGRRELESETVRRYEEKFQIFLGIAFALLGLEAVIGERAGTRNAPGPAHSARGDA